MKIILRFIVCLFVFCGIMASKSFGFEGLAIMGDSISTGAATHPNIEFDSKALWDVFVGQRLLTVDSNMVPEFFRKEAGDLLRPMMTKPSVRENDGGTGWIWHHLSLKISRDTLEEARLSYGYFLGRKLGIAPENILFASENGTVAKHSWLHAARIIGARNKDLPSKIIMFYTGNDLCASAYEAIIDAESYKLNLLKGMKYLLLNGHAHSSGTKIYVPSFLPVVSLLHEPSIMNHKIKLYGEEVTCQEARKRMFLDQRSVAAKPNQQDPRFVFFSSFMPPSPIVLCPTLFGKAIDDSAMQSLIANRIREFRDAQKESVHEFNRWRGELYPGKSFEAVFIEDTASLKFVGEDIAGDCFHLSAVGQGKVAEAMLKTLK